MTEYLKMVSLPSWWQKLELKDLSISELFEELLSWNLESKLITPKYITGTYFGAIVAIFNFCFLVCFLYVMFFLTPERALKAGPATCCINFLPFPLIEQLIPIGAFPQDEVRPVLSLWHIFGPFIKI